jgi:hypothetical protein
VMCVGLEYFKVMDYYGVALFRSRIINFQSISNLELPMRVSENFRFKP